MRCPTLAELPPPPAGKSGWPWTIESPQLPDTMRDGKPWPRISIVTPSYNQGQFIEETIRSVLLQGYPDLEYFVMDGGSTDQSVEIIKKYQPWLAHWVSEKDRGQAHAINKGFDKATGTIGAYLNSDDYYLLGTFNYAADSFCRHNWDLLIGRPKSSYLPRWRLLRRSWWLGCCLTIFPPLPYLVGEHRYNVSQESTFWSLRTFSSYRFDEEFRFCLDLNWYGRIARGAKVMLTSRKLGYFRIHPGQKSSTIRHIGEREAELNSKRQIARGINKSGNNIVLSDYMRKRKKMVISWLTKRVSEFIYVHPK